MAYKFIDIDEANLKSLASIQVIVNNFNLDRELEGYRTLNVSGRSVFGRDIETLKYSARKTQGSRSNKSNFESSGANIFFGSEPQGLVIEVEFLLQADNNKKFREVLSKFMKLIHEEQSRWEFTDDPTFYYWGTLSEVEPFKEDSNSIKSTFKIVCVDPYKHSAWTYDIKGQGRSFIVDDRPEDDMMELLSIRLDLMEYANKLIIRNGNLKIIIDYDFKPGDIVSLSPSGPLSINGRNAMTSLDITSDKENFYIAPEDEITLSRTCKYHFTYKIRSY